MRKLGTHETRSEGRIHVAIHENEVGLALQQDGLDRNHDARGLLGVSRGTDFEIAVGLRHFELLEENIGHRRIVVLTGVHKSLRNRRMCRQGAQHRRGFHKIRTSADDVKNVHAIQFGKQ